MSETRQPKKPFSAMTAIAASSMRWYFSTLRRDCGGEAAPGETDSAERDGAS
jgi:hypothetical protein